MIVELITYIHWNFDPYLFQSGNFGLRWYGVMWGLALMLGYAIAVWIYEREGRNRALLLPWIQWFFLGGLIGARLGDVLFYNLDWYLANPQTIPMIWKGGLSSHGGAIGIFAGTWIYCRSRQLPLLWHLDRLVLVMPLAGALIRLGNLFNSEIIGKPSTLPWAFVFEQRSPVARHPSQLYECLLLLGIFALLLWLYRAGWAKRSGLLMGLFFSIFFSLRFILEFLKEEAEITQLLNLPFIVLGLAALWYSRTIQPSSR